MMAAHMLGVLALLAVALLLGATWYETVVMAPNYERDIPGSIVVARQFLARTTPAHFFRVVAPCAQLLTLLAVILGWHKPGGGAFLVALAVLIVADIITYTFHYPRLAIMFKSGDVQNAEALRRAARQWASGNLVRGVLLLVAFGALLAGTIHLAEHLHA
ncbi:MAG: anthrone oxygenase family protein [Gemmatimonadaceae bacterium]